MAIFFFFFFIKCEAFYFCRCAAELKLPCSNLAAAAAFLWGRNAKMFAYFEIQLYFNEPEVVKINPESPSYGVPNNIGIWVRKTSELNF